jgi:uncharacterized protein with PIN domain
MARVHIRFYEELNFFLAPQHRKQRFAREFAPGTSVKNLIENLGVPHTEVDLILANGDSVGFTYRLRAEDMISVYPVFESFDIGSLSRVRPEPLRELKFVLDVHLGTLATELRLLGFDTLYRNNLDDDTLASCSREEHRVLLTRDRGLLKRKTVTHGYYIRSRGLQRQLGEIMLRFDLRKSLKPFTRCLKCNTLLEAIPKSQTEGRVPAFVYRQYARFKQCPACRNIYWKGSHWGHMQKHLQQIFSGAGPAGER